MSDENYRYRVKSILGQVMYVYDDRVILTQEEFEAKKKQILGL